MLQAQIQRTMAFGLLVTCARLQCSSTEAGILQGKRKKKKKFNLSLVGNTPRTAKNSDGSQVQLSISNKMHMAKTFVCIQAKLIRVGSEETLGFFMMTLFIYKAQERKWSNRRT